MNYNFDCRCVSQVLIYILGQWANVDHQFLSTLSLFKFSLILLTIIRSWTNYAVPTLIIICIQEVGDLGGKDILKPVSKKELIDINWFKRYKWEFIIVNFMIWGGIRNYNHHSDCKKNKVLFGRKWWTWL